MLNHGLLCHYHIAMLIRFCSLDCDMRICSSHDIVRLWSSHCDVGFLFDTLHCYILTLGYVHHIVTSGNGPMIAMLGYECHIVTLGCVHHIATLGYVHHIATFGNVCHIMKMGYLHNIATTRLCSSHCDNMIMFVT
jgi:hypothetical protein